MRANPRCRSLGRKADRPAACRVIRRVGRSVIRSAHRCTVRVVLPYPGPTLREITSLFNASYKMIEQYQKQRNPRRRFKTVLTTEETERKARADLQRAYGDDTPIARQLEGQTPTSPPLSTARPPPPKPYPSPDEKRDLTPVPLKRRPGGILACDWDAVRPPIKSEGRHGFWRKA